MSLPAASPASHALKLRPQTPPVRFGLGSGLGSASARPSADMASVVCRVQFLDDSDPFICTNFPEPRRPPTVSLEEDVPLSEQVAGIHKLLEAPLKVGHGRSGSGLPGSWTGSEVM